MLAKPKEKDDNKTPAGRAVPIRWHVSDEIITRFASNMVVQRIENDFKLSFFELKPDIRIPPNAEPLKEVVAECVASIIITKDRLPKFIDALLKQQKD